MRRVAKPTRKISITLKDSTFERLNHYLSYDQSRSAYIDDAIVKKLDGIDTTDISEFSSLDLLETLRYRFHINSPENTLVESLFQILSK